MSLDLILRGSEIVTAGATMIADIGIVGGRVVQIGGEMHADSEIDAAGKLLFPGGLDMHVHLSMPPGGPPGPRWVDDFTSGSAAALAGGITTIGNMSNPTEAETPQRTLERESELVRQQAIADVILHPVLGSASPEVLADIPRLPDARCSSIKIFMVMPQFDADVPGFVRAIRLAGESGLITMIHCEDHALIDSCRAGLIAQGRESLRWYPESAPVVSEAVAVQRAVAFAEVTGSPVYIVHLSSRRALAACAEAQARGLPVYVETRPLYLHLTRERFVEEDGAKYVGQPPLREEEDVQALWAGLRQGTVHSVCSDHAPYALADKLDPEHTITQLRAGVENLQFLMPMLYSEGVRTGRISLSRFVEVTATNAAKLFGLYPRKGTIAIGSDADITLFDPARTQRISHDMLKSNADYSVYEGHEVTGWPILTLRRGEIVFRDGDVIGAPGSGELVSQGATQIL